VPNEETHGDRGRRQAAEENHPRDRQDLSLLSVEELTERIALMNAEIERLQQAAAKKRASKDAANSFSSRRVVGFESNSFRRPCERRDPYRVIYR